MARNHCLLTAPKGAVLVISELSNIESGVAGYPLLETLYTAQILASACLILLVSSAFTEHI